MLGGVDDRRGVIRLKYSPLYLAYYVLSWLGFNWKCERW
jgi:hypothetical protein